MKQYKSIEQSAVDIDEKSNTVVVYYSSFGSVDKAKEIVTPGAFTKTLKELGPQGKDQIYHFKNHRVEVSKPKELFTDSYGLKAVVEFPNTTLGRDTIEEYKFGMWKYHSFGYSVIKAQQKNDITELLELKLYEGSHVLYPCNDMAVTQLVDLKSDDEILTLLKKMEAFMSKSSATDETLQRIESQYAEIKSLLTTEPIQVTQPSVEDLKSVFNNFKTNL